MRTLAIVLVSAAACSSPSGEPGAPDAGGPGPGDVAPPDGPGGSAAPRLPAPTGTCPTIVPGDVTFAPAGIPPRKVKLSFDAAASGPGELVLYWHATGSGTFEAQYSLGDTATAIEERGGVIAAPTSDPAAGTFEWFVTQQNGRQDDFLLADEVVACLAQAGRIDARRIHSMGMSAGALQTTALSFVRSSYIASVATYSGGMPEGYTPDVEDPANKFAALIFDGGTADNVFGVDFNAASERYRAQLAGSGHYAVVCDHGNGHEIPLDAASSVDLFFTANPFGAWPSPFAASGLPASFPSYCPR